MSKMQPKQLKYELKIVNNKLHIEYFDLQTKSFLQKEWQNLIRQLFDFESIQKISCDYIIFSQRLIYKDLKQNKEILQNKLQKINYISTKQVYTKSVRNHLQRILNIKITIPKNDEQSSVQKVPYKQFILATEIIQYLIDPSEKQFELSFDTRNSNGVNKPNRQIVIEKGRSKNYFNNHYSDELSMKLPKCVLHFYYNKDDHSKITQILFHLEQYKQEWLLYPMSTYLDQFSLDKIYYEELINKIIIKKSKQLFKIAENQSFQLLDKTIKLVKDDILNIKNDPQSHSDIQEGYFLGFHVFGSTKNYLSFFYNLNLFFQSRRIWILRPQKICCCPNIIDVEEFLQKKQKLQTYLISDHIVAIIKSKQQIDELTSIRHKQKLKKQNILTEEERLLKILLTGVFVLDINDYDQEDLYYVYKQRQGYKKFLKNQYDIDIHFTSQTTKLRICVRCEIAAYRIFKGCIYSYINDMKKEKEELYEFSTPFQNFIFNNYLKEKLENEFPDIRFVSKKKKNFYRLWVRFHSKDRSALMDRIQQMRRQAQRNLDYIVCKKQPISQEWFSLYRRPQTLSIQTLTCRKYIISKDTKVYVQPYQSLSRQVDEMLFLIDQSFENCWQFTQIAQQNDINLMSLFLEFQQRKKKKPDRIKSIPLTNHRYIGKMILWYNDMLKKIENRRQQDLKKLYKRYQQKTEMHIMIPRHASTNILLHFVLPSFIKQFTQQTGYSLKSIYFYYPILFDQKHSYVQDLTMEIIDQQMRRVNIQLQNESYLQKETIKKIIEMDYVGVRCMFQDDQRVWKATNLAAYIFFIQREILKIKKSQSLNVNNQNQENQNEKQIPNFKIPLFFMDASFNKQILLDLKQESFFIVSKHSVQGPFQLKSQKKYQEIKKCMSAVLSIFRSLSYVVLYIDKNFNVSKNGYFYSHKQHVEQTKNQVINQQKIDKKQKQVSFAAQNANFKKKKTQTLDKQPTKVVEQKKVQRKFTLFPMKIEINTNQSKRVRYIQTGKIVKRGSRRLKIQIIQSQLINWYMAETYKDKLPELQQYLKRPNNYKNNENFLLQEISQYSIYDMKEQVQKSRFLDFEQLSNLQNDSLKDSQVSMDSLDLSMIVPANNSLSNESKSQVSLQNQIRNMSSFSIENSLN